jgi:AhpC/TSA family.
MQQIYPKMKIGEELPKFVLKDVSGEYINVEEIKKDIIVIIFWSNECPYVKAYEDRVKKLQQEFPEAQFIAINSNDDTRYPIESFENMIKISKERSYNFYYLKDETQEVAKIFGAICTPHVFVFYKKKLVYQGRIDDSRDPNMVKSKDLYEALYSIRNNKEISNPITKPFGCSIKWKF